MNKTGKIKSKILAMIPIVIVAFLCTWFSYNTVWSGDAISYGFYFGPDKDAPSYDRIETLRQIWSSQVNHYNTLNGRFFCHILVQIFCALLPKLWFAIANGIISMLFMLVLTRFASKAISNRVILTTSVATLFWLAGWNLSFDPPILINYVWMGLMSFLWIYIFLEKRHFRSWWSIVLWIIFSFLTGEGNESFSMPIGATIIIWFFICRGRFSRLQWLGAVAYGTGGLVLCLAPGNFVRINTLNSYDQQPFTLLVGYIMENLLPVMIIPTLFLFMVIFSKQFRTNLSRMNHTSMFLCITVICSVILCAILARHNFVTSDRMLYISLIATIIILLINIHDIKSHSITFAFSIAVTCVPITVFAAHHKLIPLNNKLNMLMELYHKSESGLIVLPDSIYAIKDVYVRNYDEPWVMVERNINPSKPRLKIYPESLTKIDFETDTNLCVQFMNQGWIIIQSKNRPADFYIDKLLLPGIIGKKMSSRKVDFSPESVILVDSTANSKVAIYINHRPYIESAISMHNHGE